MTRDGSFETGSNPLWEELRTRLQNTQIHYIRPNGPEDCDWDSFRQVWDTHNIISISDWNASDDVKLIEEANVKVTKDIVHSDVTFPFDGIFDWRAIRDALVTVNDWDVNSSGNQAGQAAGSLIRFTEDIEPNTSVIADFSDGVALGSVVGPCWYDPKHDITEVAASHHFIREVHWARQSDGELITLPYDCFLEMLPSPSQSITRVDTSEQLPRLIFAIGFLLNST